MAAEYGRGLAGLLGAEKTRAGERAGGTGGGRRERQRNRRLGDDESLMRIGMRGAYKRSNRLFRLLMPEIEALRTAAHTDRFSDSERAHTLAPLMDTIGQQERGAESTLARNLTERGLGDSSAMASGLGAITGSAAQARAKGIANLFQSEREKLLSVLAALATGQQKQALATAAQKRTQDVIKETRAPQKGGFGFEDVLGLISPPKIKF